MTPLEIMLKLRRISQFLYTEGISGDVGTDWRYYLYAFDTIEDLLHEMTR